MKEIKKLYPLFTGLTISDSRKDNGFYGCTIAHPQLPERQIKFDMREKDDQEFEFIFTETDFELPFLNEESGFSLGVQMCLDKDCIQDLYMGLINIVSSEVDKEAE